MFFFPPITNNDLETAEKELIAITGLKADKLQKFGLRFLELLEKFKKELRGNMEGADMSQFQSQYPSQPLIHLTDQDDEENFINSDDDEDYVETGERSEYFASNSANFQPPVMSQAQRGLMEQVAGANQTGGGGSSSRAVSGARVKKAYGAGPKRGARKGAGSSSGSGTKRRASGGKRFSAGSANSQGGSSRGGRGARGGGGRGGMASTIRPMA